ncbi:MAG: formate dehydrogenase accessory sulfurtransferase FdhD [Chloroflexota bacterium]
MDAKIKRGALPHTYIKVERGTAEAVQGGVIEETYLTIRANGYTVASMMCSPVDEEALALGFLYNEAIITTMDDVKSIEVDAECVNVLLHRRNIGLKRQMIMTSGCGAGVTFHQANASRYRVETGFTTTPDAILARMRDLQSAARLYNAVRGVHTALLGTEDAPLYSTEDVGRHNTVDKIAGKVVRDGVDVRNCILITSGRISSEMISKAHRLNIPVVASRTAPTSTAVELAEAWEICLVGYIRRNSMRVYTHPFRLRLDNGK